MINTSNKKQLDIDFNSLSFKITKPEDQFSTYFNTTISSNSQSNPLYTIPSTNIQNVNSMAKKKPAQSQSNTQTKLKIKQYMAFEDTQASNVQQQTINPFRRTCHLFKHVEREKSEDKKANSNLDSKFCININHLYDTDTDGLDFIQIHQNSAHTKNQEKTSLLPFQYNPTQYSLENFDSFQNKESKQNFKVFNNEMNLQHHSKTETLKKREKVQNQHIKIKQDFMAYTNQLNSDEFSLIMDDFSRENLTSDIISTQQVNKNKKIDQVRRIKTQYEHQQQNQSNNINLFHTDLNKKKQNKGKMKKQSNSTFFLTAAQSQTINQSSVQQFYFDLRREQQKICSKQRPFEKQIIKSNINRDSPQYQSKSLKRQIQQILINFITDIDLLNQHEIDSFFIERLQNCLISVKKIPNLPIPNRKFDQDKLNSNRNRNANILKTCPDLEPDQEYDRKKSQRNSKILTPQRVSKRNLAQNKENIKNTTIKEEEKRKNSNVKGKVGEIEYILDKSCKKSKNIEKNIYKQFEQELQKQKQNRFYHKVSDLKYYKQQNKKQREKRKWVL